MMMRRLLAIASLLLLAVGPPLALLRVGVTDVSAIGLWSLSDVRPVLVALTAAAWAAWAWWTCALVVEVVISLSGWRPRFRLVGFGMPRALAAGLLAIAFASVQTPAHAAPTPVAVVATDAAPTAPTVEALRATPTDASATGATVLHRVAAGDDLWSLAEHYYGEGTQWRQIAAANAALGADPLAALVAGTDLAIPDPVTLVTVQRGDTLSKLALRHLGDADRWPEIQVLNQGRIADPDEIDIGWVLRLPWTAQTDASPAPHGPATPEASSGSATGADAGALATPGATPGSSHGRGTVAPGDGDLGTPEQHDSPLGPNGQRVPIPEVPEQSPARGTLSPPTQAPAGGSTVVAPDALPASALAGGLTALSAAAVLGGVGVARRVQRQSRPVGRRFVQPGEDLARYATALSQVATVAADDDDPEPSPARPELLTRALRRIAAHWREVPESVGALASARLDETGVSFEFVDAPTSAPAGFVHLGNALAISYAALAERPQEDGPVAFPALVTLGRDDMGGEIMLDALESGVLGVACEAGQGRREVLSALLIQLSCAPWAEEVDLHLVTGDDDFVKACGAERITAHHDLPTALSLLDRVAAARAAAADSRPWRERRLDADLAGAWAPQVWLFERPLAELELCRLRAAVDDRADGLAAVLGLESAAHDADWRLDWDPAVSTAQGREASAEAAPATASIRVGPTTVTPQTVPDDTRAAITGLFALATTADTEPAPWWREGEPMDIVSLRPGGDGARKQAAVRWGTRAPEGAEEAAPGDHPRLHLLGPIDLTGCAGQPPARAARQCIEYCAWLHLHPGASPQEMGRSLLVAEGTRRSNMSRLRTWLGSGRDGDLFLPDAYSGRIELSDEVTSDWGDLLVLTAPGINGLGLEHLLAALRLVRGAPLADAAPGQWGWAEELRADAGALIRDVGVLAARKALDLGDVDTARWAASRALMAAPDDELLMVERIRTERQAGRDDDVRRLVQGVSRTARALGTDLLPATVDACQEAVEGRLRARR